MPEFVQDDRPLHPDYPLPDVDDPVMRPFWDGTRAGKLMQQRDRVTGATVWPPKPLYWKGGDRLEWFQAAGRGAGAGGGPPEAALLERRGSPGVVRGQRAGAGFPLRRGPRAVSARHA